MVEGLQGHRYELAARGAYLDGINKFAPAGELPPVVVAAPGPKMLAPSGAKSRGAVPYNVTPKHTAEAASILRPSKWLAVEQKVTVETDSAKARALGRKQLSRYMVLPNYRNSWLRQGFTEADLADGGNDRFIDAMVLWVMPTRSSAACGRTSRLAPRMSVGSLSARMVISRPRPHAGRARRYLTRACAALPQSRSATASR
jgi:probable F420-dependent oxidoreductase